MEKLYKSKNLCSGCSACYSVCPFGAIEMKMDNKGFLYPSIDEQNCKHCGKCQNVCQTRSCENSEFAHQQQYYMAIHKNDKVLLYSQSGGLFTAISDIVLNNGGTVYGCIYDINNHYALHVRAITKEERNEMRGSKYIQSDLQSIFSMVKDDLLHSKHVLFTGTPCQCDGLTRFLETTHTPNDKLLMVDIICHGVPSPLLWKEHITYLEKKYKGVIHQLIFRDKSFGWTAHIESFWINGKKHSEETFKNLFYSNVCLRPSCYECRYANLTRCTDITIGDAWKKERGTEHGGKEGETLLIINSDKGIRFFTLLKDVIVYQPADIKQFMQPNLIAPSISKENTEAFWKSYKRFGYKYLLFVFGDTRFTHKCYKIIRRNILKYIKV